MISIRKQYTAGIAGCVLALISMGCGSSTTAPAPVATANVVGSAGDGPIVGGTVTVKDATNAVIGTATTDANAHYTIAIPAGSALPLTVTITGGVDQVTGLAPEFPLETAVTTALSTVTDSNANANPISTIAVQAARALGGVTAANLTTAVNNVRSSLSFGADFDPIGTVITAANIGPAVKANEAAAELIRRATVATGKTLAQTIAAIAEDLTDGAVDGNVAAGVTATQVSANVAAQIQSKIAEVSVEAMTNALKVTNSTTGATLVANATTLLNTAVTTSIPAATATMATVPVTAAFIQQARAAVQASNALVSGSSTGNATLSALDTALAGLTAGAAVSGATLTTLSTATTNATALITTAATNAAAGTNVATANSTAAGVSRFKLASNTGTVQDYNGAGTALATFSTSAGTFSAGALTLNLGTALNGANLSNLASAAPTGTAPSITLPLANLKVGSGTAQITALLKDGSTVTRTVGQRQLQMVFSVNWTSDGTTLTITPATGNATATYFTAPGTATVTATVTNTQANILASGGNVSVNMAVSNLFSATSGLATILNAVSVQGSYYYQVDFTNFPLADANNNVITSVKGTFSVI